MRFDSAVLSFSSSDTSIPQLFAVMRQWVPQTQRNMSSLAREVGGEGGRKEGRKGESEGGWEKEEESKRKRKTVFVHCI